MAGVNTGLNWCRLLFSLVLLEDLQPARRGSCALIFCALLGVALYAHTIQAVTLDIRCGFQEVRLPIEQPTRRSARSMAVCEVQDTVLVVSARNARQGTQQRGRRVDQRNVNMNGEHERDRRHRHGSN